MPVFLKGAHALDTFECYCCGKPSPKLSVDEHHKIKREHGGQDTVDNIVVICKNCHGHLHHIENAIKSEEKRRFIPEMLMKLYPDNQKARENCYYLATTAALARDSRNPKNVRREESPDYSMFDTDELVHLSPPKVSPKVRDLVQRLCRDMKNPRTGRPLGVSAYLKLLVEADLRKRGMQVS